MLVVKLYWLMESIFKNDHVNYTPIQIQTSFSIQVNEVLPGMTSPQVSLSEVSEHTSLPKLLFNWERQQEAQTFPSRTGILHTGLLSKKHITFYTHV